MKEFLLNLWEKIKKSTVKVKILLSLLIVLYIGIVTISLVQLEVDATKCKQCYKYRIWK